MNKPAACNTRLTMKIKAITLFSGYDSQCLALDRLREEHSGFDYELLAWSEIDKYAIQAHNLIYPQWADRNLGDVSKIEWEQYPQFRDCDLLTYSFPCFLKGTLIETKTGLVPIENIFALDDEVLTHKGRYRQVLKFMEREYKGEILTVRGMMCGDIQCTPKHPFYVRERYRKGHKGIRTFREPEWVHADSLTKNHYLGFAVNLNEKIPEWGGSFDGRWGHKRMVNHLRPLLDNNTFWYLMGRYVGDGWKRGSKTGNGIIICCSERNEDSLLKAIEKLGWNCTINRERTVTKVIISMNELCDFVNRYGYKAHGKYIDKDTLDLPRPLLRSFIDGYLESDGCYNGQDYKITTVSEKLAYTLVQCVAKAYHCPARIYKTKRPEKVVIEGRTCNQRDTYQVAWHPDKRKQDKAFYEDGYVWFPIREILSKEMETTVYNMEVEEDNSYTANGAIVHNCQDISAAGKQRGFEQGSGTRSGLLWECEKAIKILRPKYLLMENVKALVSKKFMPFFQEWIDLVDGGYGYRSHWKVLNATDYGVPQNRERVFMVSIREDIMRGYDVPEPFPLTKTLDDVLEEEVEDRYYLKNDRIEGLLTSTIEEMRKKNGYKFKAKKKTT